MAPAPRLEAGAADLGTFESHIGYTTANPTLASTEPAMDLLKLSKITVRFGEFTALDSVSFSARAGAAVALLGENGAGKSTLVRVVFGMLVPDSGAIDWNGRRTSISSPAAARKLGIGMVHQHFTLIPAMTVAENLALSAGGRVSVSAMRTSALDLMERTGIHVDPSAVAGRLPVGTQQRVEILKALSNQTRLLILDEPTAVLAPAEVEDLFAVLARLRDKGTALVLITHKLPEALALADDVVVLRRGAVALSAERSRVNANILSNAMVGRTMTAPLLLSSLPPGAALMSVRIPRLGAGYGAGISVRAGETVGIAGVEGNGQTELAEAVVGLRKGYRVSIAVGAALVDATRWTIGQRIRWGMAHIPEDRHATALALTMSVKDNLYLSGDSLPRKGIWIDRRRSTETADILAHEYDVRAPSLNIAIGSVSGGNQQKVVVARELSRSPKLLVAVNPTRGLDVSAAEFVHDSIRRHRSRGGGTLLVSSELEEVLTLSDRVLAMYNGAVVGSVNPRDPGAREELGRLMTTGADSPGDAE